MALSPKERENIVEEETLRFQTRAGLGAPPRGGCRGRLWLWCLAFFVLGYAVHGLCLRGACHEPCPYAMGGSSWHCPYAQGPAAPSGAPGSAGRP